jgi:hypothetical protein
MGLPGMNVKSLWPSFLPVNMSCGREPIHSGRPGAQIGLDSGFIAAGCQISGSLLSLISFP